MRSLTEMQHILHVIRGNVGVDAFKAVHWNRAIPSTCHSSCHYFPLKVYEMVLAFDGSLMLTMSWNIVIRTGRGCEILSVPPDHKRTSESRGEILF